MPNLDQTGPLGEGPKTGQGQGPCDNGNGESRNFGRGNGFGRGFGRGLSRILGYCPFQPKITKEDEMKILSDETETLEKELKTLKEHIARLKEEK